MYRSTAWGCGSPRPNLVEVKAREAQGRRREAGSERSVDQRREPMNKNRMMRPTVRVELANDSEARFHQEYGW
jgi:hypothetical protein